MVSLHFNSEIIQSDTQRINTGKMMNQENGSNISTNGNKKVRYKTLIIHGGKYRTTFTRKFENRKAWQKPNEKKILSHIPGTIKEIYIKEGDRVMKGDNLLVLEAMKMLNTIVVPHDGKIKKIHVTKGGKIAKGYVMAEFE
jgi:biotin carboxyl carrier protein